MIYRFKEKNTKSNDIEEMQDKEEMKRKNSKGLGDIGLWYQYPDCFMGKKPEKIFPLT